jgi:tRNA A-37 threonylcarbamoyl transferase component Bud32
VADSERDDRLEQLVRDRVGGGFTVEGGPVWLAVTPDRSVLPAHGWKLHISSRAATFPALVEAVLPALVAERCPFKLARSQEVLGELNEGITSPAAVGKALTVYPDQRRVCELGTRLAEILDGHQGPRILSDKRVSGSAPVYYRYGPFVASPVSDALGELVSWLDGPHGERFEALAALSYRQPPWAVDPFTGQVGEVGQESAEPTLVGGRYRIVAGIRESARGNVYRAVDESGAIVIVKQARALVAEDGDARDTRLRLRNERRIYQALADVAGLPRFIDHFRHGDDEFLVISDCGPRTLAEEVLRRGAYRPDQATGPRSLDWLAGQLAQIVSSVHERGVIVRDLAPTNIVLDEGQVSIVDFGLGAYQGLHLTGGTPGYAPARQLRDEPPQDTDDLHTLGMTLLFAATRLHPVSLGPDSGLPRVRAWQAIRSAWGAQPAGVIAAIADLLSGGDRARRALRQLASGRTRGQLQSATPLPAAAMVTPDLIADIKASLLGDLLGQTDRILSASGDAHEAHDASVYSGSAGIGLELLHHLDDRQAAARVGDLAVFTARAASRVSLPPGLFTGGTGVAVFLQQVTQRGIEATGAGSGSGRTMLPPDFKPEGDDLIVGAAGVGLGHLILYRASGDPAHLDIARRCSDALMGTARPESGFRLSPEPETAVEPSAGRAHGLAGTAELLLSFADQTGETPALEAAARSTSLLAERTTSLLAAARGPAASPLAASWCQGLTGIGQTLLHGSVVLQAPGLATLARQAAEVCIALVPRQGTLGQCCGAAGVGNFLIDLALLDQDERYWDDALKVAAHLLLRSAGPAHHPILTDPAPGSFGASWAAGLAGLLTFFRRLADRGGPDILPFHSYGTGPPAAGSIVRMSAAPQN